MKHRELIKILTKRCETGKSPKEWWGDPQNAGVWLKLNKIKEESGDPKINTTLQSADIVLKEIECFSGEFQSVLEVGAGNGRLIGAISEKYKDKQCYSVDINPRLSRYVKKKYPRVQTATADVIQLPFADDAIDLVFTYQVLQHVPEEDIKKALSEIKRVARKEVWLWEGRGRPGRGYTNGQMTHKACGGSFVWFFETMVKCYSVSVPQNENCVLNGQRLYKIK